MCPLVDATDAGSFEKRGRADTDSMPFLRDPRGDGIAPVLVAAASSKAAEQLPAFQEAVDWREAAPDLSLDLIERDRVPFLL